MLTMRICYPIIVLFGLVSCDLKYEEEEEATLVDDEDFYDDDESRSDRSEEYDEDIIRLAKRVTVPYIGLLEAAAKLCTVCLIKPNWAITSSSCIYKLRPDDITLTFAINNYKDLNGIKATASQLYPYPEYNPNGFHNDIALIRFVPSLPKAFDVIPFGVYDWPENLKMICNTAGFNNTGESFKSKALAARGVKYCSCMNEDRFICVNQSITTLNNNCTTDIGGPLVCENYLFGIRFSTYNKLICNGEKQSVHDVMKNCTRKMNKDNQTIKGNESIINLEDETEKNPSENIKDSKACTIIYTYINDYVPWIESVMESYFNKHHRKNHSNAAFVRSFPVYDYQMKERQPVMPRATGQRKSRRNGQSTLKFLPILLLIQALIYI